MSVPPMPEGFVSPWAPLDYARAEGDESVKLWSDELRMFALAFKELTKTFGAASNYSMPGLDNIEYMSYILNERIAPAIRNDESVTLDADEYNNLLNNVDVMIAYCYKKFNDGQE